MQGWPPWSKQLEPSQTMMSSDLFSVSDRVVLITGAGSGIGMYAAQGLARAGAGRVYITGRRAALLDAAAEAAPGILIPLVGDVSTIDGCKAISDAFVQKEREAGVQEVKLDMLFNNAGIAVNEGTWAEGATGEQIRDALLAAGGNDWARIFAVNVASIQVSSSPIKKLTMEQC